MRYMRNNAGMPAEAPAGNPICNSSASGARTIQTPEIKGIFRAQTESGEFSAQRKPARAQRPDNSNAEKLRDFSGADRIGRILRAKKTCPRKAPEQFKRPKIKGIFRAQTESGVSPEKRENVSFCAQKIEFNAVSCAYIE